MEWFYLIVSILSFADDSRRIAHCVEREHLRERRCAFHLHFRLNNLIEDQLIISFIVRSDKQKWMKIRNITQTKVRRIRQIVVVEKPNKSQWKSTTNLSRMHTFICALLRIAIYFIINLYD